MNQSKASLLTARDAAERLGVKLETLYAYVSRGRLHSVAVPGTRERHYRPEDIEALRAVRGSPKAAANGPAATEALVPVIGSSICLIENGRLYYRGIDALQLSDTATLEDIAALLWNEQPPPRPGPLPSGGERALPQKTLTPSLSQGERGLPQKTLTPSLSQGERGLPQKTLTPPLSQGERESTASPLSRWEGEGQRGGLIERCQVTLADLAAVYSAPADLTRAGVIPTGRRILGELVGCVTRDGVSAEPAHARLAAYWGLDDRGAGIVRRCLVLLADHELNASTFVARVVASTAATPYAVVSAALAALSGPRHGGASARAEAFFRELDPADPVTASAERLMRGERLPGIGHPLYPEGDPRAVAILYAISAIVPHARRLVYWRPNVDFALAAATTLLGLPPGAALGLFIVGRSVGWIAHAIEQYESGVLIRPRARYTGPKPLETPDLE